MVGATAGLACLAKCRTLGPPDGRPCSGAVALAATEAAYCLAVRVWGGRGWVPFGRGRLVGFGGRGFGWVVLLLALIPTVQCLPLVCFIVDGTVASLGWGSHCGE